MILTQMIPNPFELELSFQQLYTDFRIAIHHHKPTGYSKFSF